MKANNAVGSAPPPSTRPSTRAAPKPAAGSAPADAAVAAVMERMVTAWAAHDADGMADLFVPEGMLVLPGVYLNGREEIRSFMSAAYAGPYKGTRVTGKPIGAVKLGQASVAVLTEGGVIAAGRTELAAGDAIRASWVVVRRNGIWKLAVYHNCPRDPKP
jgi:uncharacterized protein (TIGR02246 family)